MGENCPVAAMWCFLRQKTTPIWNVEATSCWAGSGINLCNFIALRCGALVCTVIWLCTVRETVRLCQHCWLSNPWIMTSLPGNPSAGLSPLWLLLALLLGGAKLWLPVHGRVTQHSEADAYPQPRWTSERVSFLILWSQLLGTEYLVKLH